MRVTFADEFEGGWQNLHDAQRARRTFGPGVQRGFCDGLRLEPVPVELWAEIALCVFTEMRIVFAGPVFVPYGQISDRRQADCRK